MIPKNRGKQSLRNFVCDPSVTQPALLIHCGRQALNLLEQIIEVGALCIRICTSMK